MILLAINIVVVVVGVIRPVSFNLKTNLHGCGGSGVGGRVVALNEKKVAFLVRVEVIVVLVVLGANE